MEKAIYEKINPIGEFDELKISTFYSKGSGIYVLLQPVHRHEYGETSMLLATGPEGGLRILVKELKRKSQKQEDLVLSKIAPHSKELAVLYNEWKSADIINRCVELTK